MPQDSKSRAEEIERMLRASRGSTSIRTSVPIQDEDEETQPERRYRGALGRGGALVTRILGGIASGVVGAVPSMVTTPSAMGIGAFTEGLAQKMESPDPIDKGRVALESGLAAIPLGKVYKLGKPIITNMLRGAAVAEGGHMARRMYDTGDPLPDNADDAKWDAINIGLGALGGAMGHRTLKNKLDTPPAPKPQRATVGPDGVRRITATPQETARSTARVSPDDNVDPAFMESAAKSVLTPVGKRLIDADKARIAREAELRTEVIKPPVLNPKGEPGKVLQVTGGQRGAHVGGKANDIDGDYLDTILYRRTRDTGETTEATETALRNLETAGTTGKRSSYRGLRLRTSQQAAEQNSKNLNAGDDFVEKAIKDRAAERAQEKAASEIQEAKKGLEPNPPSVTETVKETTPTGANVLRKTFTAKADDAADEGGKGAGKGPKDLEPTAPADAPIKPLDPKIAVTMGFTTREKALEHIAMTGRRGYPASTGSGRYKWRIVLENVAEETPTPKPVTPETPAAPKTPEAAPKAGEPTPTPKAPPVPEQPTAAAENVFPTWIKARHYAKKTGGTVVKTKDGKFKVNPPDDTTPGGSGGTPPPAGPAPAPVRPKRGPKGPAGGAQASAVPPAVVGARSTGNSSVDARLRRQAARAAAKPVPAPVAPEAPAPIPAAPVRKTPVDMKKREIDAVTREEVKNWTPEELQSALAKWPNDKRLTTIINDELKFRQGAAGNAKPAEAPQPPKVGSVGETPNDWAAKHPVGSTIHAYGSEGTVLTHGPSGVRVKFTKGRMAKEQGANGYFDVDPNHINTTIVPPAKPAAVKAGDTAAPAVTEKRSDAYAALQRTGTARSDETNTTVKLLRDAPDAPYKIEVVRAGNRVVIGTQTKDQDDAIGFAINELFRFPDKTSPVLKAAPVSKSKTPEAPTTAQVVEKAHGKEVIVDLAGVKTPKDVVGRILDVLRKYKDEVDEAGPAYQMVEGGKRVDPRAALKPIAIKIGASPNSPTYTIKPEQVDKAIAQFSSKEAESAFRSLVGKAPTKPNTIPEETNWGPAKKPTIMRQGDADNLRMSPDIVEHDKLVGPKAVGEEFTPKGVTVRYAETADALPASAKHGIMRTDKDGNTTLFVSDDPNKLTPFISKWKKEIRASEGKYAAKRGVKEGVLPEGETSWASYMAKSKFDASKAKFGVVGEESFKPLPKEVDFGPNTVGAAQKKGAKTLQDKVKSSPVLGRFAQEAPAQATAVPERTLSEAIQAEVDAATRYGSLKDALAEGKATKEELKAAGAELGRVRAEVAKKAIALLDSGQVTEGQVKQALDRLANITKRPLKQDPDSSDVISKLPPEEQGKRLADIVSRYKAGKQTGAAVNELLMQSGLAVAGAVTGAAATPEDPLTGALLGGIGAWSAPTAFRALINHLSDNPNLPPAVRQRSAARVSEQMRNATKDLSIYMLPDLYRASLLTGMPSLPINAWIGPYGAAVMAAIEHGLAGDPRGWRALRSLTPANFSREFRTSWSEAKHLLLNANERTEGVMGKTGPLWFRQATAFPATVLTQGDVAARRLLVQAGFSEPEARAITLTSEPLSRFAAAIGNFRRTRQYGQPSVLASMLLPFYKTNANQLEQGLMRIPLVGPLFRKHWHQMPLPTRHVAVQQLMSGSSAGVATVFGYFSGQQNEYNPWVDRQFLKITNNFGGQYGATMALGYVFGRAMAQGKNPVGATVQHAIRNDLAIPSTDVFMQAWRTVNELSEGNYEKLNPLHPDTIAPSGLPIPPVARDIGNIYDATTTGVTDRRLRGLSPGQRRVKLMELEEKKVQDRINQRINEQDKRLKKRLRELGIEE